MAFASAVEFGGTTAPGAQATALADWLSGGRDGPRSLDPLQIQERRAAFFVAARLEFRFE